MTDTKFIELCKNTISDFYLEFSSPIAISFDDIFVVWQCKTLQNFKAILAVKAPDSFMFECSYNGDKNEMYFDAYDKIMNKVIK